MVDGIIEEKTGAKNPLQNTNVAKNLIPIARSNLTTQSFLIPANSVITIPLVGNYIKYDSGNGDIRIQADGAIDIVRKVGSAIRIREFDKIYVTNLTGVADQKTFTIGFGEVKDNFITGSIENVETIETIDVLTDITNPVKTNDVYELSSLAGNSFRGGGLIPSVGSNYSYFGLRNPVDSGKILIVDLIEPKTSFGTYIYGVRLNFIDNDTTLSPLTGKFHNLKFDGSAGQGVFVGGNETTILGTQFDYVSCNVDKGNRLKLKNKIVVPEGYTLLVIDGNVSADFLCSIEWREIDV